MGAGFQVGCLCRQQAGEPREGQNKQSFGLGLLPVRVFYSRAELPFCFSKNLMGMMARASRTTDFNMVGVTPHLDPSHAEHLLSSEIRSQVLFWGPEPPPDVRCWRKERGLTASAV